VLERIFAIADELRARLLDGFGEAQIAETNAFLGELIRQLDRGLSASE
jgi:hypothetical protein